MQAHATTQVRPNVQSAEQFSPNLERDAQRTGRGSRARIQAYNDPVLRSLLVLPLAEQWQEKLFDDRSYMIIPAILPRNPVGLDVEAVNALHGPVALPDGA